MPAPPPTPAPDPPLPAQATPPRADSPADAIDGLSSLLAPVEPERVPLHLAAGRVLAQPLLSDRDSPPITVSAMDGYALRLADAPAFASTGLPVLAESRIGQPPLTHPASPGLVRIVTGAPVPVGSDAVVRVEDTATADALVRLTIPPERLTTGLAIRSQGENARAADPIAPAGTIITAPLAAALATFGSAANAAGTTVRRRVRVAILTTGDELADPADPAPPPWRIRDSNGPALLAFLSTRPWLQPLEPRRIPDDPAALAGALASALDSADAILFTGGVSMGHRDFLPYVLARAGVRTIFHTVPQRPGKPILGAVAPATATLPPRPILGLPGNPVSVMVTARRIALPVLATLAGLNLDPPPAVTLADPDGATLNLWWHRLVTLGPDGRASLLSGRGSGDVPAAARSSGFVELPPGTSGPGPWPYHAWNA